jgi:3-oxoadipate enol-lactonase
MRTESGLKYHVFGDGPEAVLLCPGFGLGRWLFHRLIPPWSREWAVVAWDPRGVADNQGRLPVTLEGWVADGCELLDRIGRPAHVVGVSSGSWVAARLAAARPRTVQSLVLAGTSLGLANPGRLLQSIRSRLYRSGMRALAETMARELLTPYCAPEIRENFVAEFRDNDPQRLLEGLAAFAGVGNAEVFRSLNCPTLVVVGTHDRLTPPVDAEWVARIIPNAWMTVLLRCGHLPPVDQPRRFDEAVRGFWHGLSRLTGTAPG